MAGMKPVRLINYETHMMTAPSQTAFMQCKGDEVVSAEMLFRKFCKKKF